VRKGIKASEIGITAVQNVKRTWLQKQLVEDVDIVNFAMSNADKAGDASSQIHQGMDLDSCFVFSKVSPWKQAEAKVDGCGIESIGGLLQRDAEVVSYKGRSETVTG